MTDIFISYKREERSKARTLAEVLAEQGYSVWWDAELLPGAEFLDEISEVIKKAKAAIVLWSREAAESKFVLHEASLAERRGILIPASLDGSIPTGPLSGIHALDLSSWDGERDSQLLEPLFEAVRRKAGAPEILATIPDVVQVLRGPQHEVEYWKSIKRGSPSEKEELEAYLAEFAPEPAFDGLARARLAALGKKRFPSFMKIVGGATAIVALIAAALELTDRFDWRPAPFFEPDKEVLERYDAYPQAVTTSFWASFTASRIWYCTPQIDVPDGYVQVGGELVNKKRYPERVRAGCPGPDHCNGHNEYCETEDRSAACVVNAEWYHWYVSKASRESLPTDFETMCAEPKSS